MSRRATLSAQLAQLHSSGPTYDPDASDHLDGRINPAQEGEDEDGAVAGRREHYVDVGPSRLRGERDSGVVQTLLGEKYGGEIRGRRKIFEDDESEEEVEEGDEEDEDEEDEDEDEGVDEEDEEGEEDEENGDDDDEDEGGEDDNEQGEEEESNVDNTLTTTTTSTKALDPIAALRSSRQKDILKGQAIRRQKALFESLLTIRITYQKALTALSKLPATLPELSDLTGEVSQSRADVLAGLSELSEGMFELREGILLPGMEGNKLGKRKRGDEFEADVGNLDHWVGVAEDSLRLNDRMRENMIPILTKWSTKIQAATLSIGGKAAGSSKFLQGTKGTMGVVEAIEAGLASRRPPGPQPLLTIEEPSYRSLLREIIDTRSTTHLPDTSYRLEKKKKRDAERGASKGRKIRYTIHEKAANFAVPLEIRGGWEEGQVDELFGSLLGGVGMSGGKSEGGVGGRGMGVGVGEEIGLSGLGGLRVF